MAKTRWINGKAVLGGISAIHQSLSMSPSKIGFLPPETALAGRYGEIWEGGEGYFKAVIISPRIAKKYLGKKLGPSDEYIISFPESELKEWVRRLRVPKSRATQVRLAESNFRR